MNKRGFTLVELLSIIVILAVIVAIALPQIGGSSNSNKEKELQKIIKVIENSSKLYFLDHNYEILKVSLTDLKKGKYLDNDLINPVTEEPMAGCVRLGLNQEGINTYTYYNNSECVSVNVNLTVDLNGGSTTQSFQPSYPEGTKIEMLNPTRDGCDSAGWIVVGGNSRFINTKTLEIGSTNTKIRANYVCSNMTSLTVDLNGGSTTQEFLTEYPPNTEIKLSDPEKTCSNFHEWTKINSNNSQLVGNILLIGTENTKIKAEWRVHLTLDNKNATTKGTENIYYMWKNYKTVDGKNNIYFTNPNLSINSSLTDYKIVAPTKTGYTFGGYWYKKSDGDEKQYVSKNIDENGKADILNYPYLNLACDTTLYAKWTEKIATLTYNANGHGTAPSSVTMKYTTATNAASALSATGYNFVKWCTKADGTGTCYNAGAQVKAANTVPSAITLYAIWKAKPVRVYFNKNASDATIGGKYTDKNGWAAENGDYAYKVVNYNETVDLWDYNNPSWLNITRSGYFAVSDKEWITKASETGGTAYTYDHESSEGYSYDLLKSKSTEYDTYYRLNLYVNWKAKPIYIYYSANGGTIEGGVLVPYNTNWASETGTSYTYQTINYGESDDLWNYNSTSWLNITKSGYYAESGKEWKTKDGSAIYSQSTTYTYNQLKANATEYAKGYELDLYVNWKAKPIYIYYSANGGTIEGGKLVPYNTNWASETGTSYTYQTINYGESDDLWNYNNPSWLNITRSGYHVNANEEWKTKDGNAVYSQSTTYTYNQLKANSKEYPKGYELDLYMNWKANQPAPDPVIRGSIDACKSIYHTEEGELLVFDRRINNQCQTWAIDPETGEVIKYRCPVDVTYNNADKTTNGICICSGSSGSMRVYCEGQLQSGGRWTEPLKYEECIPSFPCGGGSCFPAGTKVITQYSTKDIDKIKIGDMVLSYNVDANKNEYRKVLNVFVHENSAEKLYSLTINGKIIEVTENHRFYIKKGNTYDWIAVKNLKIKDMVMDKDGNYHTIDKITYKNLNETVYNIEVENNHNYYVGDGILVHNMKIDVY